MFDNNVTLNNSYVTTCTNKIDTLKSKAGIVNHGKAVAVAVATPFAAVADALSYAGAAFVCTPIAVTKNACRLIGLDKKFPQKLDVRTQAIRVLFVLASLAKAVAATICLPFAIVAPSIVSKVCGSKAEQKPETKPETKKDSDKPVDDTGLTHEDFT